MEKKNTFWTEMARPVVVLVVICLVASALLGFTNAKTAPVIEENIRIEAEKTRKEVLPAASEFTELEVSEELKANGVTGIFEGDNGTGYVVTAEKTGYGGAVVVTVGFDTEGKILSVKANVSTETQGVGSKVGEASMLEKFEGLSGDVSGVTLKTGATFTSNAVRDGVQAACAAIAAIQSGRAEKMKKRMQILVNGIFKENPVLVLVLGCCSVLAISVTVKGSLGMGAALTFVLVGSNVVISALRKIIPDKIRIPCYIVVVATFVTLVEMVVHAYLIDLYNALGIFLPLIVVNCIVLGRAEMFANKNNVLDSLFDGLGMGIGYTLVLTAISVVRELLGSGSLLGYQIIPEEYTIRIISQTPGGFFMFGLAMAMLVLGMSKKGKKFVPEMGCGDGGCAGCGNAEGCTEKDKEAKN